MSNTRNTIEEDQSKVAEDIIIPLPMEFDMKVNLGYLQRSKNECMFEIEKDTITRVITIDEIRTLVQIKVNDKNQMIVHFLKGQPWDPKKVARYIREWFDLDNDLTLFYKIAKQTHY